MKTASFGEERYALYFAPAPESAWWQFGSAWLGRCAVSGRVFDPPPVPGVGAAVFRALTAAPRRYGFHATLKAPFRLAETCTADRLMQALQAALGAQPVFSIPALQVVMLDDFLALVPSVREPRIDAIAAECVSAFDHFRAPPGPAELARRRAAGLTPQQDGYLLRWGYPYVMDAFRFHLSLTGALGALPAAQVAALRDAATALLPREPLVFDAVTLFHEPSPGAGFVVAGRARFAPGV